MLSLVFSVSLHVSALDLSDDAFLLSEPHVTAMFQCLESVEQNNPKLLAQVDTVGVSKMILMPILCFDNCNCPQCCDTLYFKGVTYLHLSNIFIVDHLKLRSILKL